MTAEHDARRRLEQQRTGTPCRSAGSSSTIDEFLEKRRKLIARSSRRLPATLWTATSHAEAELRSSTSSPPASRRRSSSSRQPGGTSTPARSDPKIEHVIVKTVSGFMNAEGGTLLIGVADDGTSSGSTATTRRCRKANRDGFELFLTQLLGANISGPSPALIRTSFETFDGSDVCRVSVAASAQARVRQAAGGVADTPSSGCGLGNQTDAAPRRRRWSTTRRTTGADSRNAARRIIAAPTRTPFGPRSGGSACRGSACSRGHAGARQRTGSSPRRRRRPAAVTSTSMRAPALRSCT